MSCYVIFKNPQIERDSIEGRSTEASRTLQQLVQKDMVVTSLNAETQ